MKSNKFRETNNKGGQFSDIIGPRAQSSASVNNKIRIIEKNGNTRPARAGVRISRTIGVTGNNVRSRRGGKDIVQTRASNSGGLLPWFFLSVKRRSSIVETLSQIQDAGNKPVYTLRTASS